MGIPSRTEGMPADRAHLSRLAVGFINNMLPLDDKGVGGGEMPMQQDLFVGVEFDNEIDEVLFLIDKGDVNSSPSRISATRISGTLSKSSYVAQRRAGFMTVR